MINIALIIYVLHWYVILSIRHLYSTMCIWIGKIGCGKSAGKTPKRITHPMFYLEYIISFILNTKCYQLKFVVHQNGETAELKWSLFRRNDVKWKLMFRLFIFQIEHYFSFFPFTDITVEEQSWYVPSLVKKLFREMRFLS